MSGNYVSKEFRKGLLSSYFVSGTGVATTHLRLYNDNADFTATTNLLSMATFEQPGQGYLKGGKSIASDQWIVSDAAGLGGVRITLLDQTWTTQAGTAWQGLRWAVLAKVATDTAVTTDILLARDYNTGNTVTGIGASVTVDDLFYQIND